MADAEKEKAEKVAAARKKYEQLKKQKEKGKKGDKKKKEDAKPAKDDSKDAPTEDKSEEADADAVEPKDEDATEDKPEDKAEESKDKDDAAAGASSSRSTHTRKQSLSVQSKLRSESFRKGSQAETPLSPSPGEEVAEIYSKQKSRLEELERENKKLSKDLDAAETRSRKLEDELEPLREGNLKAADLKSKAEKADAQAKELEKVKNELGSLQRQNTHLQSLTSRARGQSNASPLNNSGKDADLQAQLDAKVATIESMSLELSSLQSQLEKSTDSTSTATDAHKEQVAALEDKLKKAEKTAESTQSELKDLRAKVDKLSAAAVKDGSEKSSSVTRIAGLEHDLETAQKRADEATKKAENLEAKLETLTKLQREGEPRRREAERERENAVKDAVSLKQKLVGLEEENRRLKHKERSKGEIDDDGIDELEDEERKRLESRVRELEGEVFELRRGVWRDKRIELQGGMDDAPLDRTTTSHGFDDVDLSGGSGAPGHHPARPSVSKGRSGFATVLQSGLNAFTGGGNTHGQDEGLLDDEDMGDFDEDAFRRAHEEDAMKRIERVKDIKRGLKEWSGWRLDLVDQRMGGGGTGEIFDI